MKLRTLDIEQLTVERKRTPVLHLDRLRVAAGDFVAVVGPNGAGKTTLLKALAGLIENNDGSVRVDGQALSQRPAQQRAQLIGYLAQNAVLEWPLEVGDVLALGRTPYGRGPGRLQADDVALITSVAARMNLSGLLSRRSDELSGGELARVQLGRLLVGQHPVLLVDEPIANLDPKYQHEVLGALHQHCVEGGCVISVLHDLSAAARYANRIVMINNGRVAVSGTAREVLTAEHLSAVFDVDRDYLDQSGLSAALAAHESFPQ